MSDAAVAGLRAHPRKRTTASNTPPRIRKFGVPPPVTFDFDVLPETSWLTTAEVAGILRCSIETPPMWRKNKDHPLRWERVNGKPLYRVRDLRAFIATTGEKRWK